MFVFLFQLDPEVHPQNEEYWGHVNPIGPRACYDEGKRVAETMCYAYMKQVRANSSVRFVKVGSKGIGLIQMTIILCNGTDSFIFFWCPLVNMIEWHKPL